MKWWRRWNGQRKIQTWYRNQLPDYRLHEVKRAFRDSTDISHKPVYVRSKPALDNKTYLAYMTSKASHYCITVDVQSHLSEYSIIHECLHIILNEKGYVWGVVHFDTDLFQNRSSYDDLIGTISNTLHHPAIYYYMQYEYGLDMSPYWEREIARYVPQFERWHRVVQPEHIKMLDIISVLFVFFVPGLAPLANKYRELFPHEGRICDDIRQDIGEANLMEPGGVRTLAQVLKKHLIRFCLVRNMNQWASLWKGMQIDSLNHFPYLLTDAPCGC